MPQWQVMTECPIHMKPIFFIVSAPSKEDAKQKVLGKTLKCEWGGIEHPHSFKVEEVLGVSSFPWTPKRSVSTIPIVSKVVEGITTTSLGERFWILSEKGQDEYKKIGEEVEAIAMMRPVPLTPTPSRGAAPVGGVILIALIVIVVSWGLYKKFKK